MREAYKHEKQNEYPIEGSFSDSGFTPAQPPKTQGTLIVNKGETLRATTLKNLVVIIPDGAKAENCIFEECALHVQTGGLAANCAFNGRSEWHMEQEDGIMDATWLT